jgi:hypothetical protein
MGRVGIRFVAVNAVLGGLILTGVGVASADSGYPTGGDKPSTAEPACGSGDIDFAQGCFLGWGRFFK